MITGTIIGRLGRDAEAVKAATEGLSINVASDQGWGDKKRTNWVRCTLWGKRAETLRPMLTKGSRVAVHGTIETREHEGKTYLECKVYEIELLSERPSVPEVSKSAVYDDPF